MVAVGLLERGMARTAGQRMNAVKRAWVKINIEECMVEVIILGEQVKDWW